MHHIYLVGTGHRYQQGFAFGVDESVFVEFRAFLRAAITRHSIRGIAEEMNVEALRIPRGSLAFHLAKDLGLAHRYCDPDRAMRLARGMKSPQDREVYWIEQLQSFNGFPTIFICGSTHIESFRNLLLEAGFETSVFAPDWEPSESHATATQNVNRLQFSTPSRDTK